MPYIRPSSDLRNSYNEISEFCKENDEPVFITKNGASDLVVMSNKLFDKWMARLELGRLLDEGLEAMRKGECLPADEAIELIRKETGL